MGKSYKLLYEAELKKSTQKEKDTSDLQEQLEKEKQKYAEQKIENDSEITKLKDNNTILLTEKKELDNNLVDMKEQLRVMELSRFASAYGKQEKDYKDQQEFWFKLSIYATILLASSVLFSIFGPKLFNLDINYYKEPGLYLLNLIFLTLFVYTLKQHSHLGNLRIDYANRKTLAQSYQHVIEDREHEEIRKDFLKNAADIFSSKAIMNSSDITIYEALVTKLIGPRQEK